MTYHIVLSHPSVLNQDQMLPSSLSVSAARARWLRPLAAGNRTRLTGFTVHDASLSQQGATRPEWPRASPLVSAGEGEQINIS